MKILSGVEQPTSGQIELEGEPVSFATTTEARDHGIAIIHQELSLAPNLSVRDNIYLGREITHGGRVDFAEETRRTAALLEDMHLDVSPSALVGDLRVGQQQIVEIARALSIDARILIMDEPTSALAAKEVEILFGIIDELTARGVSLVYISHHLEEALQVTDHAVVLRDGSTTARGRREEIDLDWIVRHMVGENFDLGSPPRGHEFGESVLRIEDLTVRDPENPERAVVDGVSLEVREGEIVCVYGLMGAGRTEMLEAVAGRGEIAGGRVLLRGEDIAAQSLRERLSRGIGLVPEDRQRDGLVQTMTVGQNLTLASIKQFLRRGFDLAPGGGRPGHGPDQGRDRESSRTRRRHRLPLRRQPAEGRDRQGPRDPARRHAPGRAQPRHRHRREGRGVRPARRARPRGARRPLLHLGDRRVLQHRAPHRRAAPREHLRRVRARRGEGRRHGRLR